MNKVYSIFLSDEEIINHVEKFSNKSQYLRELIIKDMNKEPFTPEQIDCINAMIDERLKGHTVIEKDEEIKKETALALDDLMNDF